jgi:hypothetical protein
MHVAAGYLIDERPLLCGMCHRRICDIAVINGDVALLRTSFREGIPQQKVPEGRVARGSGAVQGERPRDPNVRIFISESRDRFRIVHEHTNATAAAH